MVKWLPTKGTLICVRWHDQKPLGYRNDVFEFLKNDYVHEPRTIKKGLFLEQTS